MGAGANRPKPRSRGGLHLLESFPLGLLIICFLGLIASGMVLFRRSTVIEGLSVWTFATSHIPMYERVFAEWNDRNDIHANVSLIEGTALTRRMMSGFFAGTPVGDLIEVNTDIIQPAFRGPLDAVGFYDLTDIIVQDGIDEAINTPSFSPWTSRGRIFGLPHDVHPVLLAYRADIIEVEAGIDIGGVETWDEFMEALRPLARDYTGDGHPDRYPLELPLDGGFIEVLVLQAGGRFFDAEGRLDMESDTNAMVLSKISLWASRQNHLTIDVPLFSASNYKLIIDGVILAYLCPDWRTNQAKQYMTELAGKVKLMPLPAWTKGGRRTSVVGGTMLGIPKSNPDFETAWRLAKFLYLNEDVARLQYINQDIVTPIKRMWADPIYDEPDPYFSGQSKGRMYIDMAPHVPVRTGSPYNKVALQEVATATTALRSYAENIGATDYRVLLEKAKGLLAVARKNTQRQMDRNVFMSADN